MRALPQVLAASCSLLALAAAVQRPPAGPAGTPDVRPFARAPLEFERNDGQADPRARFVVRGGRQTMLLTDTDAVALLADRDGLVRPVVSRLVGARAAAPQGGDPRPGRSHSFIGADPHQWHRGIPRYGRVEYAGVYDGIDLVYHARDGALEYDFVVAPGRSPAAIRLAFEGTGPLSLDAAGDLVIPVADRAMRQRAPVVYQDVDGTRKQVAARFVLHGSREIGVMVDAGYDPARPLVVDPVLDFSTYLGGSDIDEARGVAVDASGGVYVTGFTLSPDFPLASPLQSTAHASYNVFVTKLSADRGAFEYSTYLGGASGTFELGRGVAVDAAGAAYVTGFTNASDFPVVNGVQPAAGGLSDAFVAKLSPDGAALEYSTYLGGAQDDQANAIAVDGAGAAYVTGCTQSADFPTANALQPALHPATPGPACDAFVTKLAPSGASLAYSTYLGGAGYDEGLGIAVDSGGQAHVTGRTSAGFTTFRPLETSGPSFVSVLNAAGSAFVYSSYVQNAETRAVAVDASGNTYLTGLTSSADFRVVHPLQQTPAAGTSAFVRKIDAAGSTIVYSTYLGGADGAEGTAIAVDADGHAYIAGRTDGPRFPAVRPLGSPPNGSAPRVFAAKLVPTGDALVYATLLGGSGFDDAWAIAVDASRRAYVAGETESTDFPVANAPQTVCGGSPCHDAFVARLTDTAPDPTPSPRPGAGRIEENDPAVGLVGSWTPSTLAGHSGGRAVLSADTAARAVLTFQGTSVTWIGFRDAWSGIADVSIDGVHAATVDTGSATMQYQAALFTASGLAPSVHTIVVRPTGAHGPNASQNWVWVDAFDVSGAAASPSPSPSPSPTASPSPSGGRIEQTNASVRYDGTWQAQTASIHSAGSAALSAETGAAATLPFSGGSVSFIGYRDQWSGIARVLVDGRAAATVDTYAATGQPRVTLFTKTGLGPGAHTISIQVTGTRNRSSHGNWVWVDAFDVAP